MIGFGRLVPYLEGTAGAGGTSLRVQEIFQHISNGHTSHLNRGFNSDSGTGGVSFYFK